MILLITFTLLWTMSLGAEDYEDSTIASIENVTRSTLAGIEAYRSALTLDWLDAEDQRQRDLLAVFVSQVPAPSRPISTDCIAHPRPSAGKVARLMLELLKNLEGDESTVVTEMIQALVRSKMLVETSSLDAEPDLEALVKTPGVMVGEPHITFPRLLAMAWMSVADPVTTKKFGWCPLQKMNKYLATSKPASIAKHMRGLEPIITRARYIMEEFIQHVTPLNIYEKKSTAPLPTATIKQTTVESENGLEKGPETAEQKMQQESHSRTFRRLILSTRAAKSSMSRAYVSPQVELSRVGSFNHVESEPLSNAMEPEESVSQNNVPRLIVRQFVLFIYFVLVLL